MSRAADRAIHASIAFSFVFLVSLASEEPAQAQARYSIQDILSPGFPSSLVSATHADRIAWIENERGMRNVYTAMPPGYEPVRLTNYLEDDGINLTRLQISDDGEIVIFLRGGFVRGRFIRGNPNRDGWFANPTSDPRGGERVVWAMSTRGGNPWRVVAMRFSRCPDRACWVARLRSARRGFTLSPDGRWVLYEQDGQIYRAPVNSGFGVAQEGGAPFITNYGRNGTATWSPDGSRVAFVSNRGDHSYIGVYDQRSPAITYLAPGVDRDSSPTWSPDGSRIAFIRHPGLPFGSNAERPEGLSNSDFPEGLMSSAFSGGHVLEIWVADASTGEGWRLWHAPADERGFNQIGQIQWQGDHIVFEAEPGNWRHWFSISVNNPAAGPVELTPGEGYVMQTAFSSDGRTLFYSSNHSGIDYRDLWRVPVAGGPAQMLTEGNGIETYPAVLSSGNEVAVLYADARRPQSVAVVPARGGDARIITSLPDQFPLDAHVVPQNVTLTAEDGIEFHNQLFLPPDLRPGEQRPALLFIHGGARRQMLLGYHHLGVYHKSYAMNQYFASQGYVVMSVNYRNSIGYGREFRNSPGKGWQGNTEYRDILAAGKYLQSRDDVDASRVGLWGSSYGGTLTAQGLARNSDVFAAGVDMAGSHLWGPVPRSARRFRRRVDPDVSWQASSISEIENWTSPVLLIEGDAYTGFSQTVGLVQLLRAHDVEFELMVFPDGGHGRLIFRRAVEAFQASDDFFDRKLVRGGRVTTQGDGNRR